jgi:hypothetical protein
LATTDAAAMHEDLRNRDVAVDELMRWDGSGRSAQPGQSTYR